MTENRNRKESVMSDITREDFEHVADYAAALAMRWTSESPASERDLDDWRVMRGHLASGRTL